MLSTVSPRPTDTAVPPSQLHCDAGAGARAGGGGLCTEPVTSGPDDGAGWYEAMPLPPPAVSYWGAGVAAAVAAGGGSAFDSTRPTGAVLAGTEPVASLGALCDENGLSLKRSVSELHPAVPRAIAVNTIARGCDHERNNSTTQDMCYPLLTKQQFGELTPSG